MSKTITPANLHKQKLSDIFESVLYDIDLVTKRGIKIYMDSWAGCRDGVCTVCLGGAAVCGFKPDNPESLINDETNLAKILNGPHQTDVSRMEFMFDSFRDGDADHIAYEAKFLLRKSEKWASELLDVINSFFDEDHFTRYIGLVEGDELKRLKNDIKRFVKLLRKNKY